MNSRIEVLEHEIQIVAVKQRVVTNDAFNTIPKLWQEADESGLIERLIKMSWENPHCQLQGLLGVCGNQAAIIDDEFDYYLGCRYTNDYDSDMERLVIPKSTWAVFPNVTDAWSHLYSKWLPTSGYELANLPCIENYLTPDQEPNSELWVPVREKDK